MGAPTTPRLSLGAKPLPHAGQRDRLFYHNSNNDVNAKKKRPSVCPARAPAVPPHTVPQCEVLPPRRTFLQQRRLLG